ncbi:hypothetical protein V6O07_10270, partial [Arthrospira platensis SPKY2]
VDPAELDELPGEIEEWCVNGWSSSRAAVCPAYRDRVTWCVVRFLSSKLAATKSDLRFNAILQFRHCT